MATIPKYVYDDLKYKAQQKVDRLVNEFTKPLQDKTEKQKQQLKDDFENGIKTNINKYTPKIERNYNGVHIRIDIPKKDYDNYIDKVNKLDDNYRKIRQQIYDDLNAQVDVWLISIFQKASDNQALELPELKIDKSKYKLWVNYLRSKGKSR